MKTILIDAVHTFVILDEGVFEAMYNLLEEYPNRKIILTNADDDQMVTFGLDQAPYEVFTLKHNPDKTDPAYYRTMLEHFGLQAEDVIYFEHNIDAVDSAKSVGIKTFYYDKEAQDLYSLKQFLDENL